MMTTATSARLPAFQVSTWALLAACLVVSNAFVYPSVTRKAPQSFVELVEPETNCRVVLLGCLHGSQSSATDVKNLLLSAQSNNENNQLVGDTVVVLELCASRVAELRQHSQSQQQPSRTGHGRLFSFETFGNMVMRTSQQKGLASAMAAAVLGGASGIQTALSGFEAGLEFTTALKVANDQEFDVVLADQAVDETLKRLGSLPLVSLSMMFREGPRGLFAASDALKTAIVGDTVLRPAFQVNMAQVLTRNKQVVQDMAKLTLPPLAMALLVVTSAESFCNMLFSQASVGMTTATQTIPSPFWWTMISDLNTTPMHVWSAIGRELVSSVLVLMMGFCALALPATRVILCERDDQLTQGIRAACRHAISIDSRSENSRVVAVLGLLHVNGVAKRLLQQDGTSVVTDNF